MCKKLYLARIRPGFWIIGLIVVLVSGCLFSGCTKSEADSWQLNPPRIVRGQDVVAYSTTESVNLSDELEITGNDGGAVPWVRIASQCSVGGEEVRDEASFSNLRRIPFKRVLPLSLLGKKIERAQCVLNILGQNGKGSTHNATLKAINFDWGPGADLVLTVAGQAFGGQLITYLSGNYQALKLASFPPNANAQLICSRFRTKPIEIANGDPIALFQIVQDRIEKSEFTSGDPTQLAFRQTCRIVAHSNSSPTERWYTGLFPVEFIPPKVETVWAWTPGVFERLDLNSRIGNLTFSNRSAVEVVVQVPRADDLLALTPMMVGPSRTMYPSHYAGKWILNNTTLIQPQILIPPGEVVRLELEVYHRCTFIKQISYNDGTWSGTDTLGAFRASAKPGALLLMASDVRNPAGDAALIASFDSLIEPVRNIPILAQYDPNAPMVTQFWGGHRLRLCPPPQFNEAD